MGGSGVSTVSVYRVPAGLMRTVRGSGRHIIKTLAARLRQLDFGLEAKFEAKGMEWVCVGMNGGPGNVCLCENL